MRKLFKRSEGDGDRWIVVGLGNPGDRYAGTRHNAGAMALDVLLGRLGSDLVRHKSGCLVAEGNLGDQKVVLARPVSYMNESGRPVGGLARFYKVPPDRLIVIHDEIDIAFNRVRVKKGGGLAGHNGLRSIAQHLRSPDFIRVRIGVGRPRADAVDHVLDDFSRAERKDVPALMESAADAVERVLTVGVDRAMNDFNVKDRS